MTKEELRTKAVAICAAALGNSAFAPRDDSTMFLLGFDSLDTIEIAMELEEATGIDLVDGDMVTAKTTFGDFIDGIHARIAAA